MTTVAAVIFTLLCAIVDANDIDFDRRQTRLLEVLLSRRPFVSQPSYQIDMEPNERTGVLPVFSNQLPLGKRSDSKVMFTVEEEICPVREGWQRLSSAKNFSNKAEVSLMQSPIAQWIYTAQCDSAYEDQKCRLIPDGHETRCETRLSHIHALVNGADGNAHWTIIDVPASCVCVQVKKAEFVRKASEIL